MQLDFIYEGGASKRYHVVDTLRTQDIAAHSFGVAWLCEYLTEGKASKNLIMAALAHDLAEHMVGDVPSPAKRAMGIRELLQKEEDKWLLSAGISHYERNLTEEEARILKLADNFDGMLFCVRERRLGNKNVEIVFGRFSSYVDELDPKPNMAYALGAFIAQQWRELTT